MSSVEIDGLPHVMSPLSLNTSVVKRLRASLSFSMIFVASLIIGFLMCAWRFEQITRGLLAAICLRRIGAAVRHVIDVVAFLTPVLEIGFVADPAFSHFRRPLYAQVPS